MNTIESIEKRFINIAKVILLIFAIAIIIIFSVLSEVKNDKNLEVSNISNISIQELYRMANPFPEISIEKTIEDPIEIIFEPRVVSESKNEKRDNIYFYIRFIEKICENKSDIPNLSDIIIAMVYHESRFNPTVKNGDHIGLMQISTYWHSDRAAKLGISNMWDPCSNIRLGIDIIEDLYYNYTNKDLTLAVMMYNMDFASARKLYSDGIRSKYANDVFSTSENWKKIIF